MSEQQMQQAVGVILSNLIVSMIYLVECDGIAQFICVSPQAHEEPLLRHTEQELAAQVGCSAHVIDVHTFGVRRLMDIAEIASPIYQAYNGVEQSLFYLLTKEVQTDCEQKQAMMERLHKTDSVYLQ